MPTQFQPFHIRIAERHDAAPLAALMRDLLMYEQELAHARNELTPWAASLAELQKQLQLSNTRFFVAEQAGTIVGYLRAVVVGLQIPRDRTSFKSWVQDQLERGGRWLYVTLLRRPRPSVTIESGYIAGAFVIPEFRQRGVGHALATAAEKWFREQGLRASELHVLFNNETARKLWADLGYEPLALGMRKKL